MFELNSFRKLVETKLAKILLIFIAITFVAWGVGDMFGGSSKKYVAKVGKYKITNAELDRRLEEVRKNLSNSTGSEVKLEFLKNLGYDKILLRNLINLNIYKILAENLDVHVDQKVAISILRKYPEFQDAESNIDKNKLKSLLRQNNINIKFFLKKLEDESAIQFVQNSLTAPIITVNKKVIDLLYNYQFEEREVDLLTIDSKQIKVPSKFTDSDLKDFYAKNKNRFIDPETRKISFIDLSCDSVVKQSKIALTDQEIKESYSLKKDLYSDPEMRKVKQILVEDEQKAMQLWEKLNKGVSFADIVKKELKLKLAESNLGYIDREDLIKELRNEVFTLEKGKFSSPIPSDIGWHIVLIDDIRQKKIYKYEELDLRIKNKLKDDLQIQKACKYAQNLFKEIEDFVAAGNDIQQVSNKYKLKLGEYRLFSQNQDSRFKLVSRYEEELSLYKKIYNKVFNIDSNNLGKVISFIPTSDVFVLFAVDNIKPKGYKEFDAVKLELVKNYKHSYIVNKAKEIANKVKNDYNQGLTNVKELIRKYNLKYDSNILLYRTPNAEQEKVKDINIYLRQSIFNLKRGQLTDAYLSQDGNNFNLAIVREIKLPNHNKDQAKDLRNQLLNNLTQARVKSFTESYLNYLYNKYDVKIFN